jgi:hypothetical protein
MKRTLRILGLSVASAIALRATAFAESAEQLVVAGQRSFKALFNAPSIAADVRIPPAPTSEEPSLLGDLQSAVLSESAGIQAIAAAAAACDSAADNSRCLPEFDKSFRDLRPDLERVMDATDRLSRPSGPQRETPFSKLAPDQRSTALRLLADVRSDDARYDALSKKRQALLGPGDYDETLTGAILFEGISDFIDDIDPQTKR